MLKSTKKELDRIGNQIKRDVDKKLDNQFFDIMHNVDKKLKEEEFRKQFEKTEPIYEINIVTTQNTIHNYVLNEGDIFRVHKNFIEIIKGNKMEYINLHNIIRYSVTDLKGGK